MNTTSNQARAIFLEAIELHSPQNRADFLERACEGNPELRARVERLLQSHELLGSFHDDPGAGTATIDRPISEGPGTIIGPYKLLQQIGEGGMGVVFMAEQTRPVQRTVALKIIKPGMDTRQVIARFEAERQALALMDHPNIAKVLYAGTTGAGSTEQGAESTDEVLLHAPRSPLPAASAGRPYFVMELVKGVPITQYCDDKKLSLRERLELFVPVCQAVQHAHQKGVIHRDIKPTNVLVAEYDNQAIPKVIDFGVAKATAQKLTERTMFTEFGQIVGTFEYMSPEQAKLNQLDIDTRSDIYALGVLLYELLTSETPFDRKRLRNVAFDEVLRIIREEEPPRPSTRLTTLAQQAASTVSDHRASDPQRLSMQLRGELDWIVMKCLDKDRNRRYESANSLAADIKRYLNDEPVQACPPSVRYRFTKFARRHKTMLAMAGVLVGALLLAGIGLGFSTLLVWRANQEARQLTYFQRVALAEREWSANNLTRADELLGLCPEELRGWEWNYVKRLRGRQLPPLRHNNFLWGCAISPDGQQIVSIDHVGNIYCWEIDTGRGVRAPTHAHDSAGQFVAFNPNGRRFATAGWNDVKIWDAASGEQLHAWRVPSGSVQGLAYGADGRVLACVSSRVNEVEDTYIWDAATGEPLFGLPDLKQIGFGIALSSDGKLLAVAGHDKTVRIVDSRTGAARRTLRGDRKFWCVSFSPDGGLLAAGSGTEGEQGSGSVKLWEVATGRDRSPLSRHGARSLAFNPDGTRLATGGIDQAVKIWDVASGEEILTLRGHNDWVFGVAFTPDGQRLVSASADRTLRIWDARPWNETEKFGDDTVTLQGHTDGVNAVAFHPTRPKLATASSDGTVKIWDAQSWRELRTLRASGKIVWDVAFAPGGDRVAIIENASHAVVLLDATTGKELQRLPLDAGADPSRIAFSPAGRRLAVADGEGVVTIFDVTNNARVHRFETPGKIPYYVTLSPDDKLVAAAGSDGLVTIWDMTVGREIEASPLRHQGVVEAVAFAPDGSVLASGGWDRTVRLWDTVTWKQSQAVIDATGAIHCIAFSSDSQSVAWGASDSTVKLWNRTSGQIQTLRGHTGWVHSVSFSPDGRLLASGSDDGTAKIWSLPQRETKP